MPNDIPSDVESRLKKEISSSFPVKTRLDEVIQKAKEGRHVHIEKGSAERKPEVQRMIDEAKAQMRKK